MADAFATHGAGLDSPASNAIAADLSSTDAVFAQTTRALYVGGAGDVKVDMAGVGAGVTFTAMAAGWHPLRVTKIYKIGTSATNIVGVY